MMNVTPQSPSQSENDEMAERALPAGPADDAMHDSDGKSRRDAMAVLAKHTAYTAPAVLAMLSLSKTRAAAGSFL